MVKKSVFLTAFFVLYLFSISSGSVDVTFLNKTFVRGTGTPITEATTFLGVSGTATIKLTNGNLDDSTVERVSSSIITLNGQIIFSSSNFNQNVDYLEQQVTLLNGQNTLQVQLRGKPGGEIKIQIIKTVQADAAAIIGAEGGSLVVKSPILPWQAQIDIPEGALLSEKIITASMIPDYEFKSPLPSGFSFLAGIAISFGGRNLAIPVRVTLFNTEMPATNQVIVMSPIPDINNDGNSDWSLLEIATVEGSVIKTQSPPFPGISADGSYAFLAATEPLAFISLTNVQGLSGNLSEGLSSISCRKDITAPVRDGKGILAIPAQKILEHVAIVVRDTTQTSLGTRIESSLGPAQTGEIIEISDAIYATDPEDELMMRIEHYLTVKMENEDPGDEFIQAVLQGGKNVMEQNESAALAQIEQSTGFWMHDRITISLNEQGQVTGDLESLLRDFIPWKNGGLVFVTNTDNVSYSLPPERVGQVLDRLTGSLKHLREFFEGVLGRAMQPIPITIKISEASIDALKLIDILSKEVQVIDSSINPNLSVTYGADGIISAGFMSAEAGFAKLGLKVQGKFGARIKFKIVSDYSSCEGFTFLPLLLLEPVASINIAKPLSIIFTELPLAFDFQLIRIPVTSDPFFKCYIVPKEGVEVNWSTIQIETFLDGVFQSHYSQINGGLLQVYFRCGSLSEGNHTISVKVRISEGQLVAEKDFPFSITLMQSEIIEVPPYPDRISFGLICPKTDSYTFIYTDPINPDVPPSVFTIRASDFAPGQYTWTVTYPLPCNWLPPAEECYEGEPCSSQEEPPYGTICEQTQNIDIYVNDRPHYTASGAFTYDASNDFLSIDAISCDGYPLFFNYWFDTNHLHSISWKGYKIFLSNWQIIKGQWPYSDGDYPYYIYIYGYNLSIHGFEEVSGELTGKGNIITTGSIRSSTSSGFVRGSAHFRLYMIYDPDGDGVSQGFDNCGSTYNPVQTDSDLDGVGDACDSWPYW